MSKAVPKEEKIAPALIISLYCNFIISVRRSFLLLLASGSEITVATFMNLVDYLASGNTHGLVTRRMLTQINNNQNNQMHKGARDPKKDKIENM